MYFQGFIDLTSATAALIASSRGPHVRSWRGVDANVGRDSAAVTTSQLSTAAKLRIPKSAFVV